MNQLNLEKKREKSKAYPSISLEEAINSLKKLQDNIGSGPYSREHAAKGLGYSGVSGPSASKIAAIAYFGLLSKKNGAYAQTELARKILFPNDDSESSENIVQAVKNPTLYGKLIEKYNNQAVPLKLDNVLINDYQINPKVAKEAAEVFKKSVEFAGIFKNGIISGLETIQDDAPVSNDSPSNFGVEASSRKFVSQQSNGVTTAAMISIPLECGIVILVPQSLSMNLAMGDFSKEIKDLNDKAMKETDNK